MCGSKGFHNLGVNMKSPNFVFLLGGTGMCTFLLGVEPAFELFWISSCNFCCLGLGFLLVHVALCSFALVEGGFLFNMSNPPELIQHFKMITPRRRYGTNHGTVQ